MLSARSVIFCHDEKLFKTLIDMVVESFRRSVKRPELRSFANVPTTSNVLAVRIHVSTSSEGLGGIAEVWSAATGGDVSRGWSYADSGGNVPCEGPKVDEYAAEAKRKGSGINKLVRASGSENHDVDAAGMLSSAGVYDVLRRSAARPKSDSPRGRPFFIGSTE